MSEAVPPLVKQPEERSLYREPLRAEGAASRTIGSRGGTPREVPFPEDEFAQPEVTRQIAEKTNTSVAGFTIFPLKSKKCGWENYNTTRGEGSGGTELAPEIAVRVVWLKPSPNRVRAVRA